MRDRRGHRERVPRRGGPRTSRGAARHRPDRPGPGTARPSTGGVTAARHTRRTSDSLSVGTAVAAGARRTGPGGAGMQQLRSRCAPVTAARDGQGLPAQRDVQARRPHPLRSGRRRTPRPLASVGIHLWVKTRNEARSHGGRLKGARSLTGKGGRPEPHQLENLTPPVRTQRLCDAASRSRASPSHRWSPGSVMRPFSSIVARSPGALRRPARRCVSNNFLDHAERAGEARRGVSQ